MLPYKFMLGQLSLQLAIGHKSKARREKSSAPINLSESFISLSYCKPRNQISGTCLGFFVSTHTHTHSLTSFVHVVQLLVYGRRPYWQKNSGRLCNMEVLFRLESLAGRLLAAVVLIQYALEVHYLWINNGNSRRFYIKFDISRCDKHQEEKRQLLLELICGEKSGACKAFYL